MALSSRLPYRILIIGGPGSGKNNLVLNLIKHQGPDIDKIYLYVKDRFVSKYPSKYPSRIHQSINCLSTEEKKRDCKTKTSKGLSNKKKRKVLIVFDNIIADMEANKKLSPIITDLFFKRNKTQHFTCFISQSYFKMSKATRINPTNYFIMKISNKKEFQQIALNDYSNNGFKDLMRLYND